MYITPMYDSQRLCSSSVDIGTWWFADYAMPWVLLRTVITSHYCTILALWTTAPDWRSLDRIIACHTDWLVNWVDLRFEWMGVSSNLTPHSKTKVTQLFIVLIPFTLRRFPYGDGTAESTRSVTSSYLVHQGLWTQHLRWVLELSITAWATTTLFQKSENSFGIAPTMSVVIAVIVIVVVHGLSCNRRLSIP